MKKYKHKTTGIIGSLWDDGHLHFDRTDTVYSCHETLWGGFLENSNDWEEVVALDFEILSFASPSGKEIGFVKKFNINYLEAYLTGKYKIHSIKRLSDGEIFSIGDPVDKTTRIALIDVSFNELFIHFEGIPPICSCSGSVINIENLKHYKVPLFTTYDGAGIFKGGEYFKVLPEYEYSIHELTCENSSDAMPKWCFSTKEAARQYVDNNKTIYSKAQINSAMAKCYISTTIGNFIKEENFKQQLELQINQ